MPLTPLVRTSLVVGAVAVGLTGLGANAHAASSTTSAKQWASGVCGAFLTFGDSVESTLDGLEGAASVEAAADSAKQGVQKATDDLQQSLDDLGKPPTPNAAKAQSAIQDLGSELSKDADAVEQALTPPPSSPGDVASAFASIGSTAQKAVGQMKSTATTLQGLQGSNALKKAFQSSSSCQQLKSDL
jgi:hypothetical protein